MSQAKTYPLFCMGNPLVDIQVHSKEILEKYKLKANDAILAEEQHTSIYEEIVEKHQVVYVAGGAAQNAARAAAYVLPENSVVYTGCVGDDDLARQLRDANQKEGVESAYLVKKGEKTGACAVVITGHDRSLVTTLRAANLFDEGVRGLDDPDLEVPESDRSAYHLFSPEIAPLVDGAKAFYVGGFFLTHGVKSALALARKAADLDNPKIFALNLSAPFICFVPDIRADLDKVLPYVDILFGNDSEAAAWWGKEPADLKVVTKALADIPRKPAGNASRPRIVVITAGDQATHVARSDSSEVKVIPVTKLPEDQIVDTNGAGDAFAGGFMGAYISGKSVEESVEIGHKLGSMCVGQVGPQLKWPKEKLL